MDEDDIKHLRKITNHYLDVKVYNMGILPGGKGPYFAQQRGYPPKSETLSVNTFFLNKEGKWVIVWRWVSVPDKEKNDCLFENKSEILAVLQKVAGTPVEVIEELPDGVSKEQAAKNYQDTGQRLIGLIRKAKSSRLEK